MNKLSWFPELDFEKIKECWGKSSDGAAAAQGHYDRNMKIKYAFLTKFNEVVTVEKMQKVVCVYVEPFDEGCELCSDDERIGCNMKTQSIVDYLKKQFEVE